MNPLFVKKEHPFLLWTLAVLFLVLLSNGVAHAYTETYKATGWQSLAQNDFEAARLAALDDALQKAVGLAVMAHHPEALTGPKAQVVMANVLYRRNKLIKRYRVISEEAARKRYRVTVTTDIRIDQLTAMLQVSDTYKPSSTSIRKEKIVVFIHERRSARYISAKPSLNVGAILADQLKQAGFSVTLQQTSPTTFAITDVFMQTPLFARQALALGRQQQADKVVMGIAAMNMTRGRLSAALFDVASGEAVVDIKADTSDADTTTLPLELGTEAARQLLKTLKSAPQQGQPTVGQGILVMVTTYGNLQKSVALRRAMKQLIGVAQLQLVEMSVEMTTLSVLGSISVQRLVEEIARLPMTASVKRAPQGPGGNQVEVVLSRY